MHLADEEEEDGADSDNERMPRQPKYGRPFYQSGGVLKNSFAHAFSSILNKKIDEDKVEQPILAKYKRPAKEVSEEQKRESELR